MNQPSGPVVITGSSGLLGANLVFELSKRGCPVAALHGRHGIALEAVPSFPFDLTDRSGTARLLTALKPAWIIHCAAATDVEWCETHPDECMRINAEASGELAAVARELGARLVYISTDAVFDGTAGGRREDDPYAPINRYALSKAAGEAAVLREIPEALIVRINLYGWNLQPKSSLAEWVLARLERGIATPGFRDVVFSPILVNDAAEWILQLMNAGCAGVYHLASSDHCSKYEFAREIASVFGLDKGLIKESSLDEVRFTAPRPRITWLCAGKISAELAREVPTVRAGLERFRVLRECGFLQQLKAAAR